MIVSDCGLTSQPVERLEEVRKELPGEPPSHGAALPSGVNSAGTGRKSIGLWNTAALVNSHLINMVDSL